jgi:hypothetical protein
MSQIDDFLDGGSASGSSIDSFLDSTPAKAQKQNTSLAGDIGTGLKRGVLQMPGMVTGLADLATTPIALATGVNRPISKAADWAGEKTGFQPEKWAKNAESEYSPEMQQAQANVEAAQGFFPTLGAVAENPRVAANLVAESLPSTIAGGVLARGAMGAVVGAEKLAALRAAAGSADAVVANAAKAQLLKSGAIAAGVGEGAVTSGQQMSQTGYEVDPALAASTALAAGVGTGLIGAGSGRLANSAIGKRLGLSDLETSMAAGTLGENAGKAGLASYAKRIGAGTIQEGLLEEAPQSYQEQVWQNLASGKPWDEGAASAAAQGAIAGGLMGGAVNAIPRKSTQAPESPPAIPDPSTGGTFTPDPNGGVLERSLSAMANAQAEVDALAPRAIDTIDRGLELVAPPTAPGFIPESELPIIGQPAPEIDAQPIDTGDTANQNDKTMREYFQAQRTAAAADKSGAVIPDAVREVAETRPQIPDVRVPVETQNTKVAPEANNGPARRVDMALPPAVTQQQLADQEANRSTPRASEQLFTEDAHVSPDQPTQAPAAAGAPSIGTTNGTTTTETKQAEAKRQEQQPAAPVARPAALQNHPAAKIVAKALTEAKDVQIHSTDSLSSEKESGATRRMSKWRGKTIERMAKVFGRKRVVFFSSANTTADGMNIGGGYTLYVNIDAGVDPLAVVGHEWRHALKTSNAAAHAAINQAATKLLDQPGRLLEFAKAYHGTELQQDAVKERIARIEAGEATAEDKAFLAEEFSADMTGNLWRDPKALKEVFDTILEQHPPSAARTIIKSIGDAIIKLVDKLIISTPKGQYSEMGISLDELLGLKKEIQAAMADSFRQDVQRRLDKVRAGRGEVKFASPRADFTNQTLPTRWPTSKKLDPAPTVKDDMITDLATLKRDPVQYEKAVSAVLQDPGMRSPEMAKGTVDEKAEKIIERMKENLLWLHDQIPEAIRERSKLWYDGARKIAEAWADRYGISESQAAGALAVLSPQKDWFMNVTMAERVLDIIHTKMDHKFDKRMDAAAFGFLIKDSVKTDPDSQKNLKAYVAVKGKTLKQVAAHNDLRQMSVWIRAYDEAYHDAKHAIVTPEGGFVEDKTTRGGDATLMSWGDFNTPGKAASIYLDGTPENINKMLGREHKVRNFYNNIYAPKDPRFLTADTHAVAANELRPLAGADKPVVENFGKTGGTSFTGMSGTYALHYEAYRRAAEARGLLPREIQSITWEAVRGLFTEGYKGKKENIAAIDKIWGQVDDGELSVDDARQRIIGHAGGIENPDWWNEGNAKYKEVLRDKTYDPRRSNFAGAKVTFEVAPDPRNKALKARWDALPGRDKAEISHKVAWKIAAKALAQFGDIKMKGELHEQLGGWLADTNPSLSIWFNKRAAATKINELARILGYALNQMSMVRTSPRPFNTGRLDESGKKIKAQQHGAVIVELPADFSAEQTHALYTEIRTITGKRNKPFVSGHTTADGAMVLLNNEAETGISNEDLTQRIGDRLHGRFDVELHTIYAEFPKKGKDNYGLRSKKNDTGGVREEASESSLRARSDQLRLESGVLLDQLIGEVEQRGIKRSPARSDASGGFVARGGSGQTNVGLLPGSVSGTGVHYSKQQRSTIESSFFGTGLKGDELPRVTEATDPRIKHRIYFYLNTGKGIKPEAGVGIHAHQADLSNIYDATNDSRDLVAKYAGKKNEFESALLDAGYDGYMTQSSGVAILLGERTQPVEYLGTNDRPEVAQAGTAEKSAFGKLQRSVMDNKSLPGGEMTGADWKRMMPKLMPEIDVSHLLDGQKYYKDQIVERQAKFSPKRDETPYGRAISKTLLSDRGYSILTESEAQSGPFDGGCLIAAKAIMRAMGDRGLAKQRGLVRLVSDVDGGQTEHYAAKVDGIIYDASGGFTTGRAWADYFSKEERLTRDVQVEEGYDENSDIPDDPVAEKKLARLLAAKLSPARAQTETPEFKAWFKYSKVVDSDGNPLVVYHGSKEDITTFKFDKDSLSAGWFTPNKFTAEGYGKNVIAAYLRIERPVSQKELFSEAEKAGVNTEDAAALRKFATSRWDGIVMSKKGNPETQYIPFSPMQIKSATDNSGAFSEENPDIRFSPARAQTETPEFEKWSHGNQLVRMGSKHVFKAGHGVVVEALHGSTGDFSIFDKSKSYIESDMGGGFYFTNSKKDVGSNYAGMGPDLTGKIENTVEQIRNYLEDDEWSVGKSDDEINKEAFRRARDQFMANDGVTMPVYVRFDNPVILGGPKETLLDYNEEYNEDTDSYDEPTGKLVDFVAALREVTSDDRYDDADIEKAIANIWADGEVEYGISASVLLDILNTSEGLMYATDNESDFGAGASREIVRKAFEQMGFDGIIDQTVNQKFGSKRKIGQKMTGMDNGTVHFIAFEPTQIKSAIGNNGQFDPTNPDIRFSPPRFFSQLATSIDKIPKKMETMPAAQWRMWLTGNAPKLGIKNDEIVWSGIEDYLEMRGKDKVTKAEVQQFLSENGTQVKDVVLGAEPEEGARLREINKELETATGRRREALVLEHAELGEKFRKGLAQPKFGQYVVPGGENYRELLITLPEREPRNLNDIAQEMFGKRFSDLEDDDANAVTRAEREQKKAENFRSSHFDQPNILAHLRMDERTDAQGDKVLFLEELQSDWGQKGREEGFWLQQETDGLPKGWTIAEELRPKGVLYQGENAWTVRDEQGNVQMVRKTKDQAISEAWKAANRGKVPSAPFVTDTKSWVALGLKRAIMYAVQNGMSKVAWASGEQNAAHYDLSKQVEEIEATPNGDGTYDLVMTLLDGGTQRMNNVAEGKLDASIGKGLAEKIVKDSARWTAANKAYRDELKKTNIPEERLDELRDARDEIELTYSGLGLKVGGEGMRAFYDQIVPQVANDVLKKLGGGKVETISIPNPEVGTGMDKVPIAYRVGAEEFTNRVSAGVQSRRTNLPIEEVFAGAVPKSLIQQGFTIPPSMAEKVQTEGVPLFSPPRYEVKRDEEDEGTFAVAISNDQKNRNGDPLQVAHLHVPDEAVSAAGWRIGDIQVTKALRRQGIASELVRRMSEHLGSNPIGAASVFSEDGKKFFENAKFSPARAQTETPEFKKWFGDSKVVDTYGNPLVVYHGSPDVRGIFADGFKAKNRGSVFFAALDYAAANSYAVDERAFDYQNAEPQTIPLFLSIRNPMIVDAKGANWKDTERHVKEAKDAGHDGIIIKNTVDYYNNPRGKGRATTVYAWFSPTQAKSAVDENLQSRVDLTHMGQGRSRPIPGATGNNGQFDPTNPDIRRSTPRSAITNQPINQSWQDPDNLGKWDDFVRTMQDKLVDTKRVIAAIRAAGVAIKDTSDPYLQEVLYHGRAAKRVSDFADNELRPMLVEMGVRKIERQELEDYLWARHATERNAQIAKINPKMPDGGSGLTNQQAADILSGQTVNIGGRDIKLNLAQMPGYRSLAAKIDAITKETTDTLVRYGLETQDTVDAWRNTYGKYVPLMRDMEADDNYAGAFNLGLGTGQGFSVRGSASKRALGSERGVIDILANVAMQRERAIVRGEKNRVAQSMYGLAITAPNPDFWLPLNPDAKKSPAQVTAELVALGLNPIDAANIANEPKQRYTDPNTGMVMERVNPQLRSRGDVLAVRINGKDRYVMFSSNERAQKMVAGMKNLDVDQLGMVMQKMAVVTRWFAAINTQYNPVFGLTNGIRDLGTGMLNLTSTELKGHQAEVFKNALSALRGVYADLRDHRAGRAPTSKWALEFEEFALEGGQTGYRDMFQTSRDRTEGLMQELKDATKGKTLLTFSEKRSPLFGWLSDYNTAIENAIRLSAYKAAKDKGMTKAQAASLAKNLTVNFNKKGLAATQLGAMYAFFNAAAQGTARIGQTLVKVDNGKFSLTGAGKKIVYGGMMAGVLQAAMFAAAGYDDEEPPQFIREKNFIIPLPDGKYLSVPYPLGFHVIPNIGRVSSEFVLGGFKNPGKRLVDMFSMIMDGFNPIGGSSGGVSQMLSPTVTDPLVALSENKDWTGKSIYKEDFNSMHPTAGWTRKKDTASNLSRWLAYGINYLTGGGKYEIGLLSPTPDQLDYLIGQGTGGVGRESLKAWQFGATAATGESMPMYKVPISGRFVGETTGQASETSKFYNNLKRIGEHKAALDEMQKERDLSAMIEYRKENPDAALVKQADKASTDISELKRRKRELLEKGSTPEQIKLMEAVITTRVKRYNEMLSARN